MIPNYQQGYQRHLEDGALRIVGFDTTPLPPPDSDQVVAVLDTGVWKNHPDIAGRCTDIGVDCTRDEILVGKLRPPGKYGPNRGDPQTSWEDKLRPHGTMVAGMIGAQTNNNKGVAACAPRIRILPFWIRHVTKTKNGKAVTTLHSDAIVKAVRALHKEFAHWMWIQKVRVVNMSFGAAGSIKGMEDNINYDLSLDGHDKLYVASAGNREEASQAWRVKTYPAAYANVLGVTGLWTNYDLDLWTGVYNGTGSFYWDTTVYPISGIYGFTTDNQYTTYFSPGQDYGLPYYSYFYGTSAAAPQVSGLAAMLYHVRAQQGRSTTYREVWNRIVATRGPDITDVVNGQTQVRAGLVRYHDALNGW